jgi:PAS domain S-box-containing protein
MNIIRKDIYEAASIDNRKFELVNIMYISARERVLSLYQMLDTTDPFTRDDLFLEFNRKGAVFAEARAELIMLPLDSKEELLLDEQGQLAKIVTPQLDDLTAMIQEERFEEARESLNRHSIKVQTSLLNKLEQLIEHMQNNSSENLAFNDDKLERNKKLIYTLTTFAFFAGLLIAFFVIKHSREAEQKLYIQVKNTQATLSSISDGVVTIEEDGSIKYMNKMAADILGLHEEGRKVWNSIRFLNNEYKQAFTQMLRMSQQKDTVDLGQYEISSNGRKLWLDICRSPVYDQDGQLIGIVLVLRDVTELKETQLALYKSNETLEKRVNERTNDIKQANIKLQESIREVKLAQNKLVQTEKMAALGGLVAGISHEINTPIGTSVTSATSIEENFIAIESQYNAGSLTTSAFNNFIAHTREGLNILNSNLRRASDLIRSFKLIAVDQTSQEWREINLNDYINEIITSLRPRLKSTNVTIDCNMPDDLIIYTNPGAIYQVISNLIINSITHGFTVRRVSDNYIDQATITIDAKIIDSNIRIFYMDNGKGMDDHTLTKAFDPFFTTRRGQGGSGLGMNIIFNTITSQLKGIVTLDSSPGNGVYVEMVIPISDEEEVHYDSSKQSTVKG